MNANTSVRGITPVLLLVTLLNAFDCVPGFAAESSLAKGVTTELHRALRRGDATTWRALLAKPVDVNARDERGDTPLHLAALRNDAEAVEALLEKDGDAKAANDAG